MYTEGGIIEIIEGYYEALDKRKNGNVAMREAFHKIEKLMGMSWDQHKIEKGFIKYPAKEQQQEG